MFNRRDEFWLRVEQTLLTIARAAPECALTLHELDNSQELCQTIRRCDILSNATRVGMAPDVERSIITDQSWFRPGAKVTRFYPDGVDYALADGSAGSLRGYDSIVLAMGSRANAALKETAERVAGQVLVIGEAAKAPGNAVLATGDALDAALNI